jgi:hypothetical protein
MAASVPKVLILAGAGDLGDDERALDACRTAGQVRAVSGGAEGADRPMTGSCSPFASNCQHAESAPVRQSFVTSTW